jgi:hypothetical protein
MPKLIVFAPPNPLIVRTRSGRARARNVSLGKCVTRILFGIGFIVALWVGVSALLKSCS